MDYTETMFQRLKFELIVIHRFHLFIFISSLNETNENVIVDEYS